MSSYFIKKSIKQFARYQNFLLVVLLFILVWPLAQRSIWTDEAMLMYNFPLRDVMQIFQPLPYYDQAGTPLVSALLSFTSQLDITVIRYILFSILVLGVLLINKFHKTQGILSLALVLCLMSLWQVLYYSTELKHYGFEVLGAVLLISWLIHKHPSSRLTFYDLLVLMLGACLGISTMVIASCALITFLTNKSIDKERYHFQDIGFSVLFFVFILSYYFLISYISHTQIANYPDVYNKGAIRSLLDYISSVYRISTANIVLLPALFIVGLWMFANWKNTVVKRFIVMSLLVFSAFGLLAILGKYPAYSSRHVVWSQAFLFMSMIIFFNQQTQKSKHINTKKPTSSLSFILLLLILPAAVYSALIIYDKNKSYVQAQNNETIQWLSQIEPINIGFWASGQQVIGAYKNSYPALEKHQYFGNVNASSKINTVDTTLPFHEMATTIEAHRQDEGAVARTRFYMSQSDYIYPAITLLEQAPVNETFLIFASHIDKSPTNAINNNGKDNGKHRALLKAMEAKACNYEQAVDLKKVLIYKVKCKKTVQLTYKKVNETVITL